MHSEQMLFVSILFSQVFPALKGDGISRSCAEINLQGKKSRGKQKRLQA